MSAATIGTRPGDAIENARQAIETAKTTIGPYGAPVQIDVPARQAHTALDALEAEAAKDSPDIRQLGKLLQSVLDGAAWGGQGLGYDPGFSAAAGQLTDAVIEGQSDLAMRTLDPATRHVVSSAPGGTEQSYHDIRDLPTLRSYAQQAALRGIELQAAAEAPDVSGLPRGLQKLYHQAVAHGWNVSWQRGHSSDGSPVETVAAIHPELQITSKQTYIDGKRFTYAAEPLTTSLARVADNPREQYQAATSTLPDLEAEV